LGIIVLTSATTEASNFKFGTQLEFGSSLPRKAFRTKIGGGERGGKHPKNRDPLLISVATEASTCKLGTQLGFREYVTITTLVPNLAGVGWATGAPQKLCGSGTMYQLQKCNKTANINVNKCVSKTHISPYAQLIPGGVVHGPLKGTKHTCNQCFYTGNFWRRSAHVSPRYRLQMTELRKKKQNCTSYVLAHRV